MTGADMGDHTNTNDLAALLERELMGKYGPLISNEDLRQALGYPSMDAFRQALSRKTLPIPVFPLPNRRGKYALVKDLALWLSRQRESAVSQMEEC
jgi:hypothetical protein